MNFIFCEILIKTLLISFVGSDPLLKYFFCQRDHENCEPTEFGAISTLVFQNLKQNVYIYTKTERPQLSISCVASEPLRWTFSADLGLDIQPVVSAVTVHDKAKTFYYEVLVKEVNAGIVRCESYENPSLAAEIYVDATNNNSKYPYSESKINSLYYEHIDINGANGFLVPCILHHPHFKDKDKFTLKKITRDQMKPESFTEDCIKCITKKDLARECRTSNCGPLWMQREMWADAGQPRKNDSARDWENCLSDLNCSLKTFNLSKTNIPRLDCNDDGRTTCSDRLSAIRIYRKDCKEFAFLTKNFNEIESCVFEAQEKTENDARYDPRFGFLLSPIDPEAVYMCPRINFTNSPVILSMSSPGPEIIATMAYNRADSTSIVKGLSCHVPDSSREELLQFHVISCQTAFDCQTQLETTGTRRQFRRTTNMTVGEHINSKYPRLRQFGKVITDPVKQGAALCFGFFSNGFARNFDLFFTGLDDQFYFLNGVKAPKAAMILLTSDAPNMTVGEGITFNCTIAHFILFPVFRFTLRFSNGTTQETTEDLHTTSTDFGLSVSKTITMILPETLKSLECAAPYRDSSQWATDILDVQNYSFAETTPGIETDRTEENITNGKIEAKNESLESGGVNNSIGRGIIDKENEGDSERRPEFISARTVILPHSYVASFIIITLVWIMLLVTATVLCIAFCRRYKRARVKTPEGIYNFNSANDAPGHVGLNDGCVSLEGMAFPELYCISSSDIEINIDDALGKGEFGAVVTGVYQNMKVAIKMPNSSVDVNGFREFLREVKIMASIGKHTNIIQFFGAVVDRVSERTCLAVCELSPFGDLLQYLRQNSAKNQADNLYVNLAPLDSELSWNSNSKQATLKKAHLCYFCEQIAAAMEFLATKRVIHGDLAARNVLVFPDFVVKITDFGLSRKLYNESNYKKRKNSPLPWRWMAIESFKYMEFSSMADMWSFGITVWEILSMGRVPYSGAAFSTEFEHQLDAGTRLSKPEYATDEIYQFMNSTWNNDPLARPTFTMAREFFEKETER